MLAIFEQFTIWFYVSFGVISFGIALIVAYFAYISGYKYGLSYGIAFHTKFVQDVLRIAPKDTEEEFVRVYKDQVMRLYRMYGNEMNFISLNELKNENENDEN
jgi:hypothetical protein